MQNKKNKDDPFLAAVAFGLAVGCSSKNNNKSVVQTIIIGLSIACIIHALTRYIPTISSHEAEFLEAVQLPKASIIQRQPISLIMVVGILGCLTGIILGVVYI